MSTDTINQRPIFASEEQNLLAPIRPPVSRMAICSFVLGLVSSLALLNLDLVVLPILAAALSLAAYLLIAKNDAVAGQNLALAGMILGIVFGTACYVSTHQRDQYLFAEAGNVGQQFLKIVSQNKLLEAYEMTRSEPERQVAGTSLEDAYKNATEGARENIDGFKKQEGVRKVVAIGPDSEWKFSAGLRVLEVQDKNVQISILMVDQKSKKNVEVSMVRALHLGIGSWHIISVK